MYPMTFAASTLKYIYFRKCRIFLKYAFFQITIFFGMENIESSKNILYVDNKNFKFN
jgi:hypothetical protein